MNNYTEDDITFTLRCIGVGPSEIGKFELTGPDETLSLGKKKFIGPGTVTVWRWGSGFVTSQMKTPSGKFQGGQ